MRAPEGTGRVWAAVGLAALGLAFVVASQQLFADRYATGDVFPADSSWNSGPDGTRALYAAFDALPQRRAERNTRPFAEFAAALEEELSASGTSTTVMVAGFQEWWASAGGDRSTQVLDAIARAGARVVIAIDPLYDDSAADDDGENEEPGVEAEGEGDREDGEVAGEQTRDEASEDAVDEGAPPAADEELTFTGDEGVNAFGRWGLELTVAEEPETPRNLAFGTAGLAGHVVEWPSSLRFEPRGEDWASLLTTADGPVLVERRLGAGTVVLLSANDFLSNRSLSEDRQTWLLTYLLGDAGRVVFDESHLGIAATPGVVALARRYKLHGVGVALALILALAVWRGASSLMPAMESLAPSSVRARSSREGLVALLRRGIAERDLLRLCFDEWSASARSGSPGGDARAVARDRDPVAGYRRLRRLLQETRRSP